jgi:hypothetical protein
MTAARPASLNVLFIGNSFTARNDVPGLIEGLAAARGLGMEHRLISAGGASLKMHWNKGEAVKAMQRGSGGNAERYDFVVLQEQSTLPVKNAARMHESVRLFDGAIRDAGRGGGAKMALYLTWARQHTPEAQKVITEAYMSIGRELGATVVPVGVAWERFLRGHDRPVLHDKDKSHPTLAGSYLAACVFFGVLFEQSPVGIAAEVEGLSAGDVEVLQRAAAEVLEVS